MAGSTREVHVSDRLSVAEDSWASLRFPEPPRTTGYLSAIAAAGMDCAFRFFTLRQDGRLLAAAYGCLVRYPMRGLVRVPLFVGGSPVDVGPPFYFASPDAADDALPALVRAMTAEASRLRTKVLLLRDLWDPGTDGVLGPALGRLGFRKTTLFADALLTVAWPDFDGYLASLPGKTRQGIRRDARQVTAAGYRVEVRGDPLPSRLLADMERLWRNLYDKHRDPDQILLSAGYFHQVTSLPESVVLLAYHQDVLVGFNLLLERGDLLEATYCGIDYGHVGSVSVPRHMWHEIIQLAIKRGFRVVDFGLSNEQAKVKAGCRLRTSHGYLRPLTRPWTLLRADRLLFPPDRVNRG